MHMEYVDTLLNGLKVIYVITLSTSFIIMNIPQESILGPLLFIIYVNDICNISKFLFSIMYADDTLVLLSGNCIDDLTCLLNKELKLLFIWLKSNKLFLNIQHTFYLLFHRARIKGNNSVVIIIRYFIALISSNPLSSAP